jgi:hypothetical protein
MRCETRSGPEMRGNMYRAGLAIGGSSLGEPVAQFYHPRTGRSALEKVM